MSDTEKARKNREAQERYRAKNKAQMKEWYLRWKEENPVAHRISYLLTNTKKQSKKRGVPFTSQI